MVNKKYKKCFCVKEINETNNPDSEEIVSLNDQPLPLSIKEEQLIDLPMNTRRELTLDERLARLRNKNGGYKRTKTKGEHLVRNYSYKSKKGGKRSMKKRKTTKKRNMKKRKTTKKRSMKKRKTTKKRSMKKRN